MGEREIFVNAVCSTVPEGKTVKRTAIASLCEDASVAMVKNPLFNLKEAGKWYIEQSEHSKINVQQEIINRLYIRNKKG